MSTPGLPTYRPHDRKADDEGSVWHYFLVEMPSKETAKCMQCDKILKTHSGSTGGLLKHLEKHKINLKKKTNASASASANASSGLSLVHTTPETTEHSNTSNSQSAGPTPAKEN